MPSFLRFQFQLHRAAGFSRLQKCGAILSRCRDRIGINNLTMVTEGTGLETKKKNRNDVLIILKIVDTGNC